MKTILLIVICLFFQFTVVNTVLSQTTEPVRGIQMRRKTPNLLLKKSEIFNVRTDAELKNLRVTLNEEKMPLGNILYYLTFDYEVQFGFEESSNDEDHDEYYFEPYLYIKSSGSFNDVSKRKSFILSEPPEFYTAEKHSITIKADNRRLEDVLDDIVRQMQNYKWEIKDGIVNIYPVKGRNKVVENLLNLPIKNFEYRAGKEIIHLHSKVMDLSEVKDFISKNKSFLYTNMGAIVGKGRSFTLDEDIGFSDLTLRDLLNRLARVNQCGWIVRSKRVVKNDVEETIIVIGV